MLAGRFFTTSATWEALDGTWVILISFDYDSVSSGSLQTFFFFLSFFIVVDFVIH